MKKAYLLIFSGLFLMSCSSDDDSNSNNTSGSYFPAETGKYWVYDVDSNVMSGRDSLYVDNDTLINNDTYQKFRTKELPYGFLSNALRNNAVKNAGSKTYVSGTVGFNISEDLPLSLPISDFIIFDEDAADNQMLSTINGTIQQEIEGYGLALSYTLTSTAKPVLATLISGTETYTNVKPVEIKLSLSINVTIQIDGIPIPFTYPLMTQQNVVVSTQYYAAGIGAVKCITDLSYQLSEPPGIQLPIPTSGSEHQEEILVDYSTD